MLLHKLVQYQQRGSDIFPPGYQRKFVPWTIPLDRSGKLLGTFIRTSEGPGSKRDRGAPRVVPDAMRASGIRPILLVDKPDYVLGLAPLDADARRKARVAECHRQFVELVQECAQHTGEPTVQAVLGFLQTLKLDELPDLDKLAPSDMMAFEVDGEFPHDKASVRSFWASRMVALRSQGNVSQCLVCGQLREPVDRHPVKIKGIPGGQTSGMSLVSANAPAFESYGLEASLISPMCYQCAEAYANGMNSLIKGEDTHLREGATVYIFWTRSGADAGIKRFLFAPQPDEVRQFLSSAYRGREPLMEEAELDAFYATALSASGGRVVVRDWIETTLAQARRNLVRYFLLQRLGPDATPFSIGRLRWGLAPPSAPGRLREEDAVGPNVTRWLIRCALLGGPLPDGLLYQAVRRNRAEQGVRPERAALIKMALLSDRQEFNEEGEMPQEEKQSSGYLCGRVLALLEYAQSSAIEGINTTLVDRFYGAASSAPASVFGLLLRNAQAHLSRLKSEKPGLHVRIQRDLEEVLSQLSEFPKTLNLREQGLFALGYYYQRQANYTRRSGTDSAQQ